MKELEKKVIEMSIHIEYIRNKIDVLASKSAVNWLKWSISGIGGLALTALLIACGVF